MLGFYGGNAAIASVTAPQAAANVVRAVVSDVAASGASDSQPVTTLVNTAVTALCGLGHAGEAADMLGWFVTVTCGDTEPKSWLTASAAPAAAAAAATTASTTWTAEQQQKWADIAAGCALHFIAQYGSVPHLRLRAFVGLSLSALSRRMQSRVMKQRPPVVTHDALVHAVSALQEVTNEPFSVLRCVVMLRSCVCFVVNTLT